MIKILCFPRYFAGLEVGNRVRHTFTQQCSDAARRDRMTDSVRVRGRGVIIPVVCSSVQLWCNVSWRPLVFCGGGFSAVYRSPTVRRAVPRTFLSVATSAPDTRATQFNFSKQISSENISKW